MSCSKMVIHIALVHFEIFLWFLVGRSMWDRLNRCRLYLEYREPCEQTRIMVCSIEFL